MPKLILIASLLVLLACLAVHAWCATRVLTVWAVRSCRCRLDSWKPPHLDGSASVVSNEAPALWFARQLHALALDEWQQSDPAAWRVRKSRLRFTAVVPVLALMVALMASLAARISWWHSLTAVLAMTALVTAFSFLSMPGELAALNRTIRRVRQQRAFPNPDDEAAVIRCARALAWDEALPMFWKLLRSKSPL